MRPLVIIIVNKSQVSWVASKSYNFIENACQLKFIELKGLERPQQLRVCTALFKDLSSVSHTHIRQHRASFNSGSRRSDTFWLQHVPELTWFFKDKKALYWGWSSVVRALPSTHVAWGFISSPISTGHGGTCMAIKCDNILFMLYQIKFSRG